MKNSLLLCFLFITTSSFSQEEPCLPTNVSCDLKDQIRATLRLYKDGMNRRYSLENTSKKMADFQKDIADYLAIHNQLITCPGVVNECPMFTYVEPLSGSTGISASTQYLSSGSTCVIRRPMITYETADRRPIVEYLGTNIMIKVATDCGDGETMYFVASTNGFLVSSSTDYSTFTSHAVGRKITFPKSELRVEPRDGKNLRVIWQQGNNQKWIDIDTDSMTFKDSSFMRVGQLNSGTCKVLKKSLPQPICDKNRKALIKHGRITDPNEYECIEFVPEIEGVPSAIVRA